MDYSQQTRELDTRMVNMYVKTRPDYFVELSESRYITQINEVASEILTMGPKLKVVLISGPSASSKTTTAHKLARLLKKCGRKATVVSVDDFFLGLKFLPVLEDGSYDMETIEGIDVPLLKKCLRELFECGESVFPLFDFSVQERSTKTQTVTLSEDGILLLEGTHTLNPIITEGLPDGGIYRLFVSVMTQFKNGSEEVFSPQNLRLARRIIRDEQFRGWSAEQTFMQWSSVCAGELLYIDPYKHLANRCIDTALDYEPAVIVNYLAPLFSAIPKGSPYMNYVEQFLDRYALFNRLEKKIVPQNSLLREFVGQGK